MADITKLIDKIEASSRGSEVRETIIDALNAINEDGENADKLGGYPASYYIRKSEFAGNSSYFDEEPTANSIKAVTSRGLYNVIGDIDAALTEIIG